VGRADRGHLIWLLALAGFLVWYLLDARRSSPRVENLILVVPAVIVCLGLIVVIAIGELRRPRTSADRPATQPAAAPVAAARGILGWILSHREATLIALFGAYVLVLPVLRFEIASSAFIFLSLLLNGERRPLALLALSILLGGGMSLLFKLALPIRLPTLL
jgi:hypothetical protein